MVTDVDVCRNRGGEALTPEAFALVTCADCYYFMPPTQFGVFSFPNSNMTGGNLCLIPNTFSTFLNVMVERTIIWGIM